jgi:flavodoxin
MRQKGFAIKGEFTSAGFDTFGPFKFIGGLKKGHPDEKDLEDARAFARGLPK